MPKLLDRGDGRAYYFGKMCIRDRLKAGQEFPPPRDNLYDRFMSGPVNPVFYRFFVKADAFRACLLYTSRCV